MTTFGELVERVDKLSETINDMSRRLTAHIDNHHGPRSKWLSRGFVAGLFALAVAAVETLPRLF